MTELAESESGYIAGPPPEHEPAEEPIQPKITEIKKARARDLVERAVFVSIKLGKPGVNKKIASERISFDSEASEDEIQDAYDEAAERKFQDGEQVSDVLAERRKVDRKLINVSKRLIDCKEYRAISTLDGKIKKYIKSRCTSSLVRNGIFLLPLALVNELDHEINAFRERRESLVKEYAEVYDQRVKEALERLGPEGNPNDYPAWEEIAPQFTFEMQYLSLQAPTVLGNINEKILAREQEKVAGQFKSAIEMSLQSLRAGMAELVNSLAEQLSSDPTGGKKAIRKVSVDKMVDFLRVFDARNLADDAALAGLVKQAKELLSGTDIKALRSDDALRGEVAKGFADIKEKLSGMVVEAPKRAITFDD